MKKILAGLIAFCIGMGSTAAHAAWYNGTINRIQFDQSGYFIVNIDAASNNECGSKQVLFGNTSSIGYKNLIAALLAWEAQHKLIQFLIGSCSGTVGILTTVEDTL